ncbi:hypothetical protein Zm00014a_038243 [Zea mays]|uniref:NB-ARC domain-containing protein n=1 Tax=Zea mays TaxID=4577 RepID=A0A3L6E096_MAIZE|nr:hypothetical protein Zm00014a_038243 [Zea mays]
MESFLSAVLGELISRSINLIINKLSKVNMEESLQRALLRAQVIIEEAMGRHITNQVILLQLGVLRDAMHRGYYALDAFRYQPRYGEDGNPAVRRFVRLSKVPCAKDLYFSGPTVQFQEQLREALDKLRSMLVDMNQLAMFLMSYPRLYRQPYSMHILLCNCMFGRQMEAQLVISFLLHTKPHSSEELDVLPVVGPLGVGKSTLIAHVCKDERVRDYFSEILWLHDSDFTDDELTFRQGGAMKRQILLSKLKKGKRLLVVIELYGNLCEDGWNRFYRASRRSFLSGSKIIVTSCSDKIVKFGTTPALNLKHLSPEAYWYFFKTLTFGSTDPEMHPRFAQLAMEIAILQIRSINSAYVTSYLLRDNFSIHFWCKVLSFLRGVLQAHISKFGVHPSDLLNKNKLVHLGRMASPSEDLIIYHQYHRSPQEEVPEIRIQDVVYGSIKKPVHHRLGSHQGVGRERSGAVHGNRMVAPILALEDGAVVCAGDGLLTSPGPSSPQHRCLAEPLEKARLSSPLPATHVPCMTTLKSILAGPSGSAVVGSLDSVLPVLPQRHRTVAVAGSLEQAGANSPLPGGSSIAVAPLRVYSRSRFRSKHAPIQEGQLIQVVEVNIAERPCLNHSESVDNSLSGCTAVAPALDFAAESQPHDTASFEARKQEFFNGISN